MQKKISSQYREGLSGWLGPKVLKEHYDWFGDTVPNISTYNLITDIKDKRSNNYIIVRKVLGKDILNFNQETGDCVSQGGRNSCNFLQCTKIILGGQSYKFRDVFPPFFYHTSRQKIGNGKINGAGSLGVWLQAAALKYGMLFFDDPNVPPYSGNLADKWGDTRNLAEGFYKEASDNLIKTTAKVTDATSCAEGLLNGYITAVCSDRGFNMSASSDGFHAPRGTWNHCMTIFDFGWWKGELYFLIMNSWGDVHGQLKDFDTGENLPKGCLRVRANIVDNMLKQDDSYMYSDLEGFIDREAEITRAVFDWFGT